MLDETPVNRTTSTLPPAWDQPGVFVSNLFSLFFGNAGQTTALCREVGRLESYGGRLVPVLGLIFRGNSPNVVVLEEPPADALLDYFRAELRLELPQLCTLGHSDYHRLADSGDVPPPATRNLLARLQSLPAGWIDGFVTDRALRRLAAETGHRTLNSPDASYAGNNKVMLHHHLVASDLPTFTTHLAATPAEVDHARAHLRHCGYDHAVIKSQVGASGVGLWKLPVTGPPADIPAYGFHEGPCLVQGWLDDQIGDVTHICSPSVQLFVRPEAVHLYDLTDQILSADSVHEGNLAPPDWLTHDPDTREEILRQAAIVGTWLHQQNYRGTASIDFHVALRTGGPEVRVCEVNARVTGATYPALLARHFTPRGAWLMRNLRFDHPAPARQLLRQLDTANLLYHPDQPTGVLPINFNIDPHHGVAKGQFLCLAPDLASAGTLLHHTARELHAADTFSRD